MIICVLYVCVCVCMYVPIEFRLVGWLCFLWFVGLHDFVTFWVCVCVCMCERCFINMLPRFFFHFRYLAIGLLLLVVL